MDRQEKMLVSVSLMQSLYGFLMAEVPLAKAATALPLAQGIEMAGAEHNKMLADREAADKAPPDPTLTA